jgi:hypothetical protein
MNQFINFFWTILCFAAIVVYWFSVGLLPAFYVFIALSLIPAFLPQKVMAKLQLSKSAAFYERLGVRFIRKFVQHGDIANSISRKTKPNYQVIAQKNDPATYLKTINMYERFHMLCLVFFLFTTAAALVDRKFIMAAAITISNVIYNFYPVLLQQYNRIRIMRLTKTI